MTFGSNTASRTVNAVAAGCIAALMATILTAMPAHADTSTPAPTATAAPEGSVPGSEDTPQPTPTSKATTTPKIEAWTPSSHSVTLNGKTTLDLFAQPAFKQDADGWSKVDPTITKGTGDYPYEALGLVNPVHFGMTADALVTLDPVNGPIVFGLAGASVTAPTLKDGVVTYGDVFPGVDLEFRTAGGFLSKHFVLADANAKSSFELTIHDPDHALGDPIEGANESWSFPGTVAFGTGIELPSPAAWSAQDAPSALPGSAHQSVSTTSSGYTVTLSVDPLWAEGATYPMVLDPAIVWTDEIWTYGTGLSAAFAPAGATDCDGGPCHLADPADGNLVIGTVDWDGSGIKNYLTYFGADLSALSGREIWSTVLEGYDYQDLYVDPAVSPLCSAIAPGDTGQDLDNARCGALVLAESQGSGASKRWFSDQTTPARAAAEGAGPTGHTLGLAVGSDDSGMSLWSYSLQQVGLHLVYEGYPAPRPLTTGQTFGCACWAGTSSTNQATAADPVNTATGGLIEHFDDVSIAGVGQPIDLSRTYNSLDTTTGPFGPGWSFAYGATLKENSAGEWVFTDGSGTQTRFGALVGGGYAPIDPAVSATLADGPSGTHTVRSLSGDTMTFNAAGALTAVADERGEGVALTYTSGALTKATDSLGQTLTFAWDTGTGTNARIISATATASDTRIVKYAYTTTAGAKRLTSSTDVRGKVTKYAYATGGGLSKITDPLGNISAQNTYNAAGRITSQMDETGAITTFGWDAATQTATITDPTGKVRTDVYNGLNLVQQIDGNGNVTEQLYDGDNNKAAVLDATGTLFRSDYDSRDRLIRRKAPAPLNYVESWTYDDQDHVTSYTDADGYTTTYHYNAAGLVSSVDNPDGGTVSYTYTTGSGSEPANLLKTSTDALGRTTTYAYSATGDLLSTTSPGGKTSTSTYDTAHRVVSTTTPAGETTTYTYDAAGHVLTTTDAAGGVTTNTFDADGRLTQSKNAMGYITKYGYDQADRLITVTDPLGNITQTSYDGAGRVATTTDARGGVTSYTYDAAGRLTGTTDPLGHATTTAYDDLGQVTSVTDPTGAVTSYTYDVLGQQTSVTDADGVTSSTTYDQRGNVASVADGLGGFLMTQYDSMNRPAWQQDSDGVYSESTYDLAGQLEKQAKPRATTNYVPGYYEDATTFTYDSDGHRTSVTDPRGNVPGATAATYTSSVTYDADGRPLVSTDALGRTVATTYDALGRPLTVTDAAGNITTRAYNKMGWVTSVKAPSQGTTSYTYDKSGNVLTRKDGLNHVTTYTYDAVGHVLSQTDPLARVTTMTYDAAGNLATAVKPSGTSTTDPNDGTATYTYDAANRVTATSYSDTTPGFTYSYTTAGRLHAATRTQGGTTSASSTYTYDDAGRVTSAVATGSGGGTTNYSYSSAGRVTGGAWSTGMSASYTYNQVGELTQVNSSGTGAVPKVTYAYDPAGNLTGTSRGTSAVTATTYAYDAGNQLTTLIQSAGSSSQTTYGITRDTDGNPTQVGTTTGGTTTTALFGYDTANRLTSECYPTSGTTCTSKSPNKTYTYNVVGDRTKKTDRTVVGTTATTVTTTFTYDAADELLTQAVGGVATVTNTWSPNGTLATATSSTGTRTYTSDLTDELTSAILESGSTVTYTTDTHGNRTSRSLNGTLDATWAWDGISQLPTRVGEYGATGALSTSWLTDPTSATGAPLSQSSGTSASWLLTDWAQNITSAVATTGTSVTGTKTVDAYGNNRTAATGSLATAAFGFSGQYLDSITGLYDMRARDYDPTTARFTAEDPAAIAAGMPYFASYQYGNANPMMYADPTGLFSINDAGDYLGGVVSGTWDMAWDMEARSPLSFVITPDRFDAAFQTDVTCFNSDVEEYGYFTAIETRVNPVNQVLVSGDAWIQGMKTGDYKAAGYAAPSVVVSTASTVLIAYGGAKIVTSKIPKAIATDPVVGAIWPDLKAGGITFKYTPRVIARAAEEPGPMHNFPLMFDETIVTQGTRATTPDGWVQYKYPGTVNGKIGNYEIGGWPSADGRTFEVDHRVFRKNKGQ